jgi:hypothetical protein
MSIDCAPDVTKQALALGAWGVVTKPFDMRDVPALVHDAAASHVN